MPQIMLGRLARFCYHRRWRVLVLWIVVLVAINIFSSSIGSAYNSTFSASRSRR